MIDPRLEEQAALAALGWAADPAGLDRAADRNAELGEAVRDYADIGAMLAYDAPQYEPPPALRTQIFAALGSQPAKPRPRPAAAPRPGFRFPRIALLPYALAACLMGLALFQAVLIVALDKRLDVAAAPAPHHDALNDVKLVDLAPQGDHGDAKIMVAWNSKTCCGMVSMSDMPDPPAGQDYQLWVLDPSQPAPVSAGVIPRGVSAQHFVAPTVRMPGRPGFAVSMEPAGGRSEPTEANILFAVAPGL